MKNNDKVTLNTLLNDYIIYIPDMQRDYCWGTHKPKNTDSTLFDAFLSSLIENKNNKEPFIMGLFYGYIEDGKVFLCDGQQRITSLYLLLLYAYASNLNLLDKNILLKNELPKLQYAVRDSSLFFLQDLVKNINNIDNIKQSPWYFNEYNFDDTIQSMLGAFKSLDNKKEQIDETLIQYVLNYVKFIFIDMQDRKTGEETYVLLNTTGEPLTPIENLKPYLVYGEDEENAKHWEEIEHFFWKKGNLNENKAENLMKKFLDIVTTTEYQDQFIKDINGKDEKTKNNTIIYAGKLKDKSINNNPNMNMIYDYYRNFNLFFMKCTHKKFNEEYVLKLIDKIDKTNFVREYYTIISLMYYAKKFLARDKDFAGDTENYTGSFIHLFYNILERNADSVDRITINDVICTINKMTNSDVLSLLDIDKSFVLKDEEEKRKLEIIKQYKDEREKIECLFSKAEEAKFLKHRILFILDIVEYARKENHKDKEWSYSIVFEKYYQGIMELFENLNDDTRELFIKYNAPHFPLREGGKYSMMHNNDDVYKWIYKNYNKQKDDNIKFIYKLINKQFDLLNDNANRWNVILKYNRSMLRFAKQKHFWENAGTVYAVKKIYNTKYISANEVSLFYTFIHDSNGEIIENLGDADDYKSGFKVWVWVWYDQNRIVVEKANKAVIDINASDKNKYIIEIFNRKGNIIAETVASNDYFSQFGGEIVKWDKEKRFVFELDINSDLFHEYVDKYLIDNNDELYTHKTVKCIVDEIIEELEKI